MSNIRPMKLVIKTNGAYDLNWAWLPYWLACDQDLRDAASALMFAVADGNPDTEETLNTVNELLVKMVIGRYPDSGIRELIEALEKVPDTILVEGIRG